MIVHPTKAFRDKMKIPTVPVDPGDDPFFAWRVHYVKEHGYRFVIFMNELTEFVVVINQATAETLSELPERFRDVLAQTLRKYDVTPQVVDRYVGELSAGFVYAKNTDRKITAQINSAIAELWQELGGDDDNAELSHWCSSRLVNTANPEDAFVPAEAMIRELGRYGMPVLSA